MARVDYLNEAEPRSELERCFVSGDVEYRTC